MIKLFIHNKPLFLVDKTEGEVEDYMQRPTTIFVDEINSPSVKTMLYELAQPEYYAGVLLYKNVEEALAAFKSHLQVIVAAGGLVQTKQNEFLLIFRKGKWDLPKGKLDEGEELEVCALREIEEETGATGLSIEKPLKITYHTYFEGERYILKESHWYLIHSAGKKALKPQIEEDIEKCEWVPIEKLGNYMSNMHASIIDVIQKRLDEMKENVS
ncbi:MAG: NUDIX domain-containing protein [Chitinophagaceae bacterium]|nr:MAG: NUDIX domain-containing protein [Chitinophagaceae bacterium]